MSKANGLPVAWLKEKGIKVAEGDMLGSDRYEEKPMTKEALRIVNDTSDHDDAYVTSFASRPNTGKQSVADDVIINIATEFNFAGPTRAGDYLYWWTDGTIESWKPNHAAMLAKFKEQGANTMFTFENTKEATHYHGGDKKHLWRPHFINNEGLVLVDEKDGWSRSVKASMNSCFELSRPPGERKEDHTIDGVVTYALQPAHHIELAIGAGAINDVISPDEPVIEPWVGDHITCPGEPVFTQEMCDNGEYPMVGCELMYLAGAGLKLPGGGFSKGYWDKTKVIARHNDLTWLESHGIQEIHYYMIKPIDNRTPEDKAMQNMWDAYRGTDTVGGEYPPVVSDILKDIKAGKIHGVKWSL